MHRLYLLWALCLWQVLPAAAQRVTVSGTVSDGTATLPGASIYTTGRKGGAETDAQGRYRLSLPTGRHIINVSYVGYNTVQTTVHLRRDTVIHFRLEDDGIRLGEVVVSAESPNTNVLRPNMGFEKLAIRQIRQLPAFMGEVDVIKAIQLLPGVQAASEGTSGFSVRGGSPDQNLILFDDATIYNASHLMGFFSVFNNDAVSDVALYKGDIPAAYGGRLSSLLEVTAREGTRDFSGSAGVGLIASRLLLQGPLLSDRATFLVAGRRTYADVFLPLAAEEGIRNVDIHFYDLNAKLQGRVNDNNYVSATGYYGRDVFLNNDMGMNFGNAAYTLRWKHLFSARFFAHFEALGSVFNYRMNASTPGLTGHWQSSIVDYGLRADFTYLRGDNTYRFGYNTVYHRFRPGRGGGEVPNTNPLTIEIPPKQAWEHALYFSNRHQLFDRLTLTYGLRFTRIDNIGATKEYLVDESHRLKDSLMPSAGEFYHHYYGWEPRLGAVWAFNEAWSVKASYARTMQFLHLLSMSTAGSPLDVWVPSSPGIRPEVASQLSAGVFANFFDNRLETSAEVYYKELSNVIDFKEHAQIIANNKIETQIRTGSGRNYGLELMVRKNKGALTGWVSYTYSRAFRTVPGLNNGERYSAPYDRPNNLNVVATCDFSKRLTGSVSWVYATGQPVTFPEAGYWFLDSFIPVYTGRNKYRFPDYHRMDASLTIRLGNLSQERKWKHELNISVYNLYARKNPWVINMRTEDDGSTQYAQMTYLFGIVPSVTYNLTFNMPQ